MTFKIGDVIAMKPMRDLLDTYRVDQDGDLVIGDSGYVSSGFLINCEVPLRVLYYDERTEEVCVDCKYDAEYDVNDETYDEDDVEECEMEWFPSSIFDYIDNTPMTTEEERRCKHVEMVTALKRIHCRRSDCSHCIFRRDETGNLVNCPVDISTYNEDLANRVYSYINYTPVFVAKRRVKAVKGGFFNA